MQPQSHKSLRSSLIADPEENLQLNDVSVAVEYRAIGPYLPSVGASILSFFSRAARSRAKSSPAWWEERVSGLEATIRKPLL